MSLRDHRKQGLAVCLTTFALIVMAAQPVMAAVSTKTSFGPVHVVFPDFFSDPGSPSCGFPVVGDWQATGWSQTFLDSAGNVTRVESHIYFQGSLSNPRTDRSVADMGHMEITDHFAVDGSFTSEAEDGVRTGFFKAAFHTVTDSQGDIVVDVGRDWLLGAKHPISIAPVCDALS